ncbi:hypothetical protein DOTSEDRAFT_74514 [Dothistroma septosporum NZE10]|uniref:N-acetyltransferase domain-containing protein n=1 Tax=Dothistroma septosporum (strain NZE10 / CBS 128990) TaxID=675120 RepID=N1PFU6_DOTSN|nr:hypothetical protein DOTSEDRAFT_74514 [Dothistroma septosporum NZE10]
MTAAALPLAMGRLHPKAHFLDVHLANGHSSTAATTTTTTTTFETVGNFFPPVFRSDITPLHLAPPAREESTRVQLQRQRLREQHARQQSVSTTIPGIKTSAAFFASLRTNLRLHASPPPSPISTPNSMRGSAASLPPPSPLSVPVMEHDIPGTPAPEDPLADVPELNSYLATDEDERTDALKLVADSVAQQRNLTNRALIYSPINLPIFAGALSFLVKFMLSHGYDEWAAGSTCLGLMMTGLIFCRFTTARYMKEAESINWEWAGDVDVLVTKFGDDVIGALLVEWVSGESRKKNKKAWRGFIRAWTVKLKYRGKGVGGGLLEEAVREAKKKGAEGLEFDENHANSVRILPKVYNGEFDRADRKAREKLLDLLDANSPRGHKKKRSNS